MKMKRITRTIIVEGQPEWVDNVVNDSLLPEPDDSYEKPAGRVLCRARTDEEYEEQQENEP